VFVRVATLRSSRQFTDQIIFGWPTAAGPESHGFEPAAESAPQTCTITELPRNRQLSRRLRTAASEQLLTVLYGGRQRDLGYITAKLYSVTARSAHRACSRALAL